MKVADMGESGVDDLVGYLIANSSNPTVGVLAHPGQVDVPITAKAASQGEADVLIAPLEEEVRSLLGDHVFATGEQTMQDIVGDLLRSKELTVASFEGLTGGLVAQQLQEADGPRFLQGTIGQQETTLQAILSANGVDAGAPSEPEALTGQLASAVRAVAGSDLGLAVLSLPDDPSPTGGSSNSSSENLRAGNTYIAVASSQGINQRVYNFAGPGLPDRTRASLHALDLLRVTLMQS